MGDLQSLGQFQQFGLDRDGDTVRAQSVTLALNSVALPDGNHADYKGHDGGKGL